MPELREGMTIDGADGKVTEHYTNPPKRYTESSLLSQMERERKNKSFLNILEFYRLYIEKSQVLWYDISGIMSGGNEFGSTERTGKLKMLDVLLSEDTEPADKKRTLQEEFGIAMTKKLEGDVMLMCNLSKGVYERAVDKTTVEYLKNMMNNKGWEIEECMDVLGIPAEKRDAYKAAILGEPALA